MSADLIAQAEQLKNKGNDFQKQKQFDAAVAAYSQGVELLKKANVSDVAVKEALAVLYSNRSASLLAQNKFSEALESAQAAQQLKPDWVRAQQRVGQALIGLNRLRDAAQHLQASIQQHPEDQQLMSLFQELLSRFQQAPPRPQQQAAPQPQQQQQQNAGPATADPNAELYEKLKSPELIKLIRSHQKLASYMDEEDFRQRIAELQKNPALIHTYQYQDERIGYLQIVLTGKEKEYIEANRRRAEMILEERKRQEELERKAKEEAERRKKEEEERRKQEEYEAMDEEERQAFDLKNKGNELYLQKKFDEALECYTKALELTPTNATLHLNRAAVYLEKGDVEKCISECQQVINQSAVDFKTRAKAYARLGNAQAKLKNYEAAVQAYKDSLVEHRDRAVVLKLQETEKLLRQHQEQSYLNPDIAKEERAKGNELFKQGKYADAIKHYRESIKRWPSDPAPYCNLALAFTKLGEYQLAIKNCEEALQRDPKYIKAYVVKSQAHSVIKEYHKALESWEQALQIEPENLELQQGYEATMRTINEKAGERDEERVRRAQQDPEIQRILNDPLMVQVLKDMSENPHAGREHLKNPAIQHSINRLIAAGIIQTR